MKWQFETYPSILVKKFDFFTCEIEVLGFIDLYSEFGYNSVQNNYSPTHLGKLIAFRASTYSFRDKDFPEISFLPENEFEKQFYNYKLRKKN